MNRAWMLGLLALAACNGNRPKSDPELLDTGWFEETTGVGPGCPHLIMNWTPQDGTQNVYWRDRPTIYVSSANAEHAYNAWLETADGERLNTQMQWDPELPFFTLDWDGYLEPNTEYVLGLQDCAETRYSHFETSGLGEPFRIEAGDLTGRTYHLKLLTATWEEPPILNQVLASLFTMPILVGVRHADDARIDLLGAPGLVDPLGGVTQDTSTSTWDFPVTDFTTAPYLEAQAQQITLQYSGTDIPVEDFLLQVTFSADGNALGGGVISGLGDTRYLHETQGLEGGEAAICNLAATVGIDCQSCSDGQPYCLRLKGTSIEGELVPGLVLNPIQ